ncbi:MAG: winged helix-turn-helix transcriptional regulator [Nitrososphaerota archaeon]|nr:winged helix-turn-helix transcriptional regulator [Nitrososphaerota archaeon]MDG7024416.1 winged helix-turn-helix transcriptional regulator [Nitrososphaerota archaeon]
MGELLGSSTRANIVEALALSDTPMTAYRIGRKYNMNVAKVYSEMKRLGSLGLVETAGERRWKEYVLVDKDLRNLALRLSSRVQTYEAWRSAGAKRERFRMGLAKIPSYSLDGEPRAMEPGERRIPGELENLAVLGRRKFDAKYRREAEREYVHV